MDELDLNIQEVVILLGDDVIGWDNGAEMSRGRMGSQEHESRRDNGYCNDFSPHDMHVHLLFESKQKIVTAGTSLLSMNRIVFDFPDKKAMKASSSFQKKRPSWPVFSGHIPPLSGIFFQPYCDFSRNFKL